MLAVGVAPAPATTTNARAASAVQCLAQAAALPTLSAVAGPTAAALPTTPQRRLAVAGLHQRWPAWAFAAAAAAAVVAEVGALQGLAARLPRRL